MTIVRGRSAKTGRFTKVSTAERYPNTHIVDRMYIPPKRKGRC